MQEVQSWLVSASNKRNFSFIDCSNLLNFLKCYTKKEKEIVKELILKAMEGLNQAGRLTESKPDAKEINLDLVNSEINL